MCASKAQPASEGQHLLAADAEMRLFTGAAEATRFFMGEGDVQHALERIACLLEADGIPYAILGGMALNAYGYRRVRNKYREIWQAAQSADPE